MKKWSSHAVEAPDKISHEISHPMNHDRTGVLLPEGRRVKQC